MKKDEAQNRAKLSGNATNILNARTLEKSHQRLAEILTEGMTVLDIGCGTGAITRGIVEKVGVTGRVVGIDNNPYLIAQARENYGHIPNLSFQTGSAYKTIYEDEFDVVTSARVLQWLAEPSKALEVMKLAAKQGGKVLILDYNHEKIIWEPTPPPEMQYFYDAFLKWRADAGMDNTIADQLVSLFEVASFNEINATPQHDTAYKANNNTDQLNTWADVAASRGLQMVTDGYVSVSERKLAEESFRNWIENEAISQTMYLLAVEGVKR